MSRGNRVTWRFIQPVLGINGVMPDRDSTRVNVYGDQTGAGSTTFYTVPANKILYISSCNLTTSQSVAQTSYSFIGVSTNAPALAFYCAVLRMYSAGQMVAPLYFNPALEASALWTINVTNSSADMNSNGIINGWLETA